MFAPFAPFHPLFSAYYSFLSTPLSAFFFPRLQKKVLNLSSFDPAAIVQVKCIAFCFPRFMIAWILLLELIFALFTPKNWWEMHSAYPAIIGFFWSVLIPKSTYASLTMLPACSPDSRWLIRESHSGSLGCEKLRPVSWRWFQRFPQGLESLKDE